MTLLLELCLFCGLFTLLVAIGTGGKAVNMLFFYPDTVQKRAVELGISTEAEIRRRKKIFMFPFLLIMFIALLLIIGLWNKVSDFGSAYLQSLVFLLVMNWYDGIVIDRLWVGKSQFWVIPALKDIPYIQTWHQVLKKRIIWSIVYAVVAVAVAALIVVIF